MVLLFLSCLVVAAIVLWPSPPAEDDQRALARWLLSAHRAGLPEWISFGFVEGAANVAMFLPLGFFAALALPRRRWLVIPAAAALSALFELLQAGLLPDRLGDLRDVLANTAGAAIGCWVAVLVRSARIGGARQRSAADHGSR